MGDQAEAKAFQADVEAALTEARKPLRLQRRCRSNYSSLSSASGGVKNAENGLSKVCHMVLTPYNYIASIPIVESSPLQRGREALPPLWRATAEPLGDPPSSGRE